MPICDGAGGIVGVQGAQHPVAGQRGLNGHPGGLQVPDLADHHYIRVLAQNKPQTVGKGHAGFAVELYLVDVVDAVFHRVLHGDDVDVRLVQFFQDGI
jgi:hypothetical protein